MLEPRPIVYGVHCRQDMREDAPFIVLPWKERFVPVMPCVVLFLQSRLLCLVDFQVFFFNGARGFVLFHFSNVYDVKSLM